MGRGVVNVCAVCAFWVYRYLCVIMCSVMLFIFHSRLLVYYAESGVNRVQVVLSLCRYCCIYFIAALVLVSVDVMVMLSA